MDLLMEVVIMGLAAFFDMSLIKQLLDGIPSRDEERMMGAMERHLGVMAEVMRKMRDGEPTGLPDLSIDKLLAAESQEEFDAIIRAYELQLQIGLFQLELCQDDQGGKQDLAFGEDADDRLSRLKREAKLHGEHIVS